MYTIDLHKLPTPQLKAIKQILVAGVSAKAETELIAKSQLCHKSPPKGYPADKSQYGDSACYRYPLNTKSRCLASWRYVHQASNKTILGDKFKSVESTIKGYAKKHYELDLQTGESEDFNWEQVFLDFYDAETMGERCDDIVLESKEASTREGSKNMDSEKIEALEKDIKALKGEKETLTTEKSELEEKASQVDTLIQDLKDQKEELESLRTFKKETDEAAERAEKLKTVKAQLDAAGIKADLDDDAEVSYWLDMSEESLKKTIAKLSEIKKGAAASASIKVPQLTGDPEDDTVNTVRKGLKDMKKDRGKI